MGTSTSKHKTKAYKLHHSYVPGRPLAPGKPTLKYDPDNLDPDTVTIKWDPPVFDGGSKITGYLVEHKRTGSPHWVKASPLKVCHTQLTVCGLEPGWRYQFRVTAQNEFGLSDPSPLSEPLAIFVHRSAAIAPYFVTELNDLVVLENEKVEFTVTFEGVPIPKICWYKDGLEAFSNRCQKITTEGCASTLLIYEAAINDESEIKCCATNRIGYAVTRAYLKVEAPPTIRLPRQYEDGLIFETGETVRLRVSVAGQPVPVVMWYLNGVEITPSAKCEMDYVDKTATLKVKNAERNDRGEYQIRACNVLGEDLASILVTIANKPQPPENMQIERIFGTSVTLSWSPPPDDGGCKIGSYIIEYYKTNWDLWLKATTSRLLHVTLEKLIEGSEYKFRVKAENPYGISEPSAVTQPIFIANSKKRIFEPSPDISDTNNLIPESVLELDVPQTSQYYNHSTPIRDYFSSNNIPKENQYSFDLQSESNNNWEMLDRRKYSPVKPERKHKKKIKIEQPSINVDLLNLPIDKWHQNDSSISNERITDRDLTPSPQLSTNTDEISRTSSELMLLLVPNIENVPNIRASSLTHDYGTHKHNFYNTPGNPPPISLSAPELGNDIQLFKPLQRNCVSSTEILHESTIARFYKELKEYDVAVKYGEQLKSSEPQGLAENFNETSQILVNRLQKNQTKMLTKDIDSEVVTDLRKIDNEKLPKIEEPLQLMKSCDNIFVNTHPSNPSVADHFEKNDSPQCSKLQKCSITIENMQTAPLNVINQQSSQTSSILSVEPHPQGRYSPRSGTFHYPDLFMESLTKSPKFKSTSGSLSEVVAELISKNAATINLYSANNASSSTKYDLLTMSELASSHKGRDIVGISKDKLPLSSGHNLVPINMHWQLGIGEEEDSNESDQFDDSDDDFNENETDTYHPLEYAPLSFEQALAISNPKRSVSPTNDLFLESEASFGEDDDTDIEPNYGLHYFNQNYTENERVIKQETNKMQSSNFIDEPKLLKPILKYNSYEEPTIGTSPRLKVPYEYTTNTIPRDNRSPKKHVRIEEPNGKDSSNKNQFIPQLKSDDTDTSLVIINHYSDIVKQYGNVQKAPSKVYMTYEELKAAAQMVEYDDNEVCNDNMEDAINYDESQEVELEYYDENEEAYESIAETSQSIQLATISGINRDETEIKVKQRVHFFFDFCLDFFMFVFACWVYCFKDERLAIPIIFLMVYRQLYDRFKNKFPSFNFWWRKNPS